MIRFVEKDVDKRRLLLLCEETAFGCKMSALVKSYGFDKGVACFWLEDGSDCAYCLVDGQMLVSGSVKAPEEARAFLRAVGPHSLLCTEAAARSLGAAPSAVGPLLQKTLPQKEPPPAPAGEVNIRDIYGLLDEAGMAGEFEPFYLDLSLKLRRGTALAFTEYRGESLIGCGVVSSISQRGAVLSALAVREDCRRQGVGSALLARAEACLPGRELYIFREAGKNESFYRRLGYAQADTWAFSRLQPGKQKGDGYGTVF